ncbi:MAG: Error-prone repair protein ImuA [Chryseolinea sp.]
MVTQRADIISRLQNDILHLQGHKPANASAIDVGLDAISAGLPEGVFPTGSIHEFLTERQEGGAATSGFIAGVLSSLMGSGGMSLWISSDRKIFPPALKSFGIQPDRFIFIDLQKEREVMWAIEEALKCPALTAVIGEMNNLSFTASRRLQLAVEQSKVTGFILRNNIHKLNPTACASRWKITSLSSSSADDLPGIGFPSWRVELLRIRNGKGGTWQIKWENNSFHTIASNSPGLQDQKRKTA